MSNQYSWRLLTASDLAAGEVPPVFALRAGLTPTWDLLRAGRYAGRHEVFASLWKAIADWRESLLKEAAAGKYLPVFWIEGQPGDGKSVLLLQLMAECLRKEIASLIAWFEPSADGNMFQAAPPANVGWAFCAEVPTHVEGGTRDVWMAALRDAGVTALVTSGSSEIRHGFEFRFEFCAQVTKFVLPPFNLSEAISLAEWFQERTGISRDVAALWREGMSLAEFSLFVLHHGRPVADLTSDIRGALGNLGLGGRVRAVWLANALGLCAPVSLLTTDAARSHAVKISERGVVPVETCASNLRLSPPSIAWPLVDTWLGEGQQAQHMAGALAFVLKAWLEAGDEKNAVRFLRQLRGTEWLVDERPVGHGNRFVRLQRKAVFRELYRLHRRDFGGQPAPTTIPAWLEINEAFSLMLLPDPVACATEIFTKPENESYRTPALAATTWLAADTRKAPVGTDAREAVAGYFLSPVGGAEAGRALTGLVRDTKKLSDARPLAEGWGRLFSDEPEALNVACALAKRRGGSAEFLAWAAEQFARPSEACSEAAKFLAALVDGRPRDEKLRQRAVAWAWSRPVEPETGAVWLALLAEKQATEDVLRGVLRWLGEHPERGDANVVRLRLLTHYPHAYGAAWVMQEWLKRHFTDQQTPGLLLKLLEAQPNSRTASAVVMEWFNQSLTHPASRDLLRCLSKHPDAAFQAAAGRWLDANPDAESHAEILAQLICLPGGVAQWIERGEQYASDPRHPGCEQVMALLLPICGCQLRHIEMAARLLPELSGAQHAVLEVAMGRALACHPFQAETVFRRFAGTQHIPNLACAMARGLAQRVDARVEFVRRVLPTMDGEAAFLTLCQLVSADIRGLEIVQAILTWLQENYRQRGYIPMLGALHKHPKVWQSLLATTCLDKRVIADFQNYRPPTARC